MSRSLLPWRVAIYGPGGALTEAQIRELSERFEIDEGLMRELSTCLASALHPDRFDADVIDVMSRFEEAESDIAKALADVDGALEQLTSAASVLNGLYVEDHLRRQPPDDPFTVVKKMLSAGILNLHGCTQLLERIQKRKPSAYRMDNRTKVNLRRVRDFRRSMVCNCIFATWEQAHGKAGTTYRDDLPKGNRRGGRVVKFVNAVVKTMITKDLKLSGETIRKDLKRYHDHLQFAAMVSIPPEAD